MQDRWDDHGYKTQYHLEYIDGTGKRRGIGDVKILQRDQPQTESSILQEPFDVLDDNYCSLGQSLDYYQRLSEIPEPDRDFILISLRDVVQDKTRIDSFAAHVAWEKSLTRDFDSLDDFLLMARTILEQNYSELPKGLAASFEFRMSEWSNSIQFTFDAPIAPDKRPYPQRLASAARAAVLPSRIAVVIGRNGSGKSTLLSRLARIAHASRGNRRRTSLARMAALAPDGLGFSRVLTVSYSGFDNFQVPGITLRERKTIANEIRSGTGRFIFCGLRNIGAELSDEDFDDSAEDIPLEDRQQRTILKVS
ncbi:hypothetical protein [Paraburkholderia sp. 35.1]|uniref:hypothetical protein n=1 Tax=Paraburkholderia sp. 35.1 TaxID=2991058 RepID=UPI003D19C1B8